MDSSSKKKKYGVMVDKAQEKEVAPNLGPSVDAEASLPPILEHFLLPPCVSSKGLKHPFVNVNYASKQSCFYSARVNPNQKLFFNEVDSSSPQDRAPGVWIFSPSSTFTF